MVPVAGVILGAIRLTVSELVPVGNLGKVFGLILSEVHKHQINLQCERRVESVLVGECFICDSLIISLPHCHIIVTGRA